jgi:hypothetical protein
MSARLTRLWLNEIPVTDGKLLVELRADFDNDRHHASQVAPPHGPLDIALALHLMADQIAHDGHLQNKRGGA